MNNVTITDDDSAPLFAIKRPDGTPVASMFFNDKGQLDFKGDVTEAAKDFFDTLVRENSAMLIANELHIVTLQLTVESKIATLHAQEGDIIVLTLPENFNNIEAASRMAEMLKTVFSLNVLVQQHGFGLSVKRDAGNLH